MQKYLPNILSLILLPRESLQLKKTMSSFSGQGSKSQRSEQVSALLTHGVGKVTKDGKKPQQLIKDPIAELPPNSIVAHLKEGMEAIHLYSGRFTWLFCEKQFTCEYESFTGFSGF